MTEDILLEAKEITDSILELTSAIVLTGAKEREEDETIAYLELMEQREPLVERLTELKAGVDAKMASTPEFKAIRDTIEKIGALDKRHRTFVQVLVEMTKASHKEVKTSQRLHNAYVDISFDEGPSRFDTKQ